MWVDCMLCDFYLITTIFNLKKYFKPGVWLWGNACLAWGPGVNPWHHKRKFKSYGGEETEQGQVSFGWMKSGIKIDYKKNLGKHYKKPSLSWSLTQSPAGILGALLSRLYLGSTAAWEGLCFPQQTHPKSTWSFQSTMNEVQYLVSGWNELKS